MTSEFMDAFDGATTAMEYFEREGDEEGARMAAVLRDCVCKAYTPEEIHEEIKP